MLHARVGQGLHAEISLVCARLEEVGHLDECEREGMCGAAVASAPGLLMLNAVTRSCADVPSPACVTQLEGLASDHSTMKSHSMSCFRRRLAITRVGCPLAAAASACCTGGAALSARCLVVEHSAPISYRNASELFERPGTQRKIDRHERLRRAPSKRKSACQESALQVWLACGLLISPLPVQCCLFMSFICLRQSVHRVLNNRAARAPCGGPTRECAEECARSRGQHLQPTDTRGSCRQPCGERPHGVTGLPWTLPGKYIAPGHRDELAGDHL